MKRTTYILFGVILAGLLAMGGFIFYLSLHATEWEDNFMEIKGDRQTVVLPPCNVVKLTQPREKVMLKGGRKSISTERVVSFRKAPLTVSPAESLQGSFSFAGDMASFMSVTTAGDTAFIAFDIPAEKTEKRFQDTHWLKIESDRMRLDIPAGVQAVLVDVEGMEAEFRDFRCDTLSFRVLDFAKVEDCRITSLAAQASTLFLKSGEVRALYLNLDDIVSWDINGDSCRVDTEYLTGRGNHHCTLERGECRQIIWSPQSGSASLNVKLDRASRIETGNDGIK